MAFGDTDSPFLLDRRLLMEAANINDCLANLKYLICEDAEDAAKVRAYAAQATERLRALGQLLSSIYEHASVAYVGSETEN